LLSARADRHLLRLRRRRHAQPPNGPAQIAQLLPAPNGKLLAFGKADSGNQLVIARFSADGRLDTSFASDGIAQTIIFAPNMADPGAIAVDATGRFAVVCSNSSTGATAGVAMFTANGAAGQNLQRQWGGRGRLDFHHLREGRLQGDGKLIVAVAGLM
jgi:hypothetical protein